VVVSPVSVFILFTYIVNRYGQRWRVLIHRPGQSFNPNSDFCLNALLCSDNSDRSPARLGHNLNTLEICTRSQMIGRFFVHQRIRFVKLLRLSVARVSSVNARLFCLIALSKKLTRIHPAIKFLYHICKFSKLRPRHNICCLLNKLNSIMTFMLFHNG